MESYKFSEIEEGSSYTNEIGKITQYMIDQFSDVSGDHNPVHKPKDVYAEDDLFKAPIAHGMLVASFISQTLGTKFPGEGTIYLGQDLQFRKPVYVNDRVAVVLTVINKITTKNLINLKTEVVIRKGDENIVAITGQATVMKK
ncbi:hypothetical protein CEW46_21165 [Bacillus cereus]|nr:hypothetical protein CEW46_21165 [Bacillus cereus]